MLIYLFLTAGAIRLATAQTPSAADSAAATDDASKAGESPSESTPPGGEISCTYGDSISEYLSCQKSKFSTTQLVAGGIGVVLGLFLLGGGIVWLISRRKKSVQSKADDLGEDGEARSVKARRSDEDKKETDESDFDDERKVAAKKGDISDDSESDDSSEDEKRPIRRAQTARAARDQQMRQQEQDGRYEQREMQAQDPRMGPRRPSAQSTRSEGHPVTRGGSPSRQQPRQQQQTRQDAEERHARPSLSQESGVQAEAHRRPSQASQAARGTPAKRSNEAASSSEEELSEADTDSSEADSNSSSDEEPRQAKTNAHSSKPPLPEVKKPQPAVQKIPRTASPDQISDDDDGSPIDTDNQRRLYPSNPSPDPRYLKHRASMQQTTPLSIPASARSRQRVSDRPMSILKNPSPLDEAPPVPSSRSGEGTRPLHIRKSSAVRQASYYEPSSRPIRSTPSPQQEAPAPAKVSGRRPSAAREASQDVASSNVGERRPSKSRRPSEAGSEHRRGDGQEKERKGSKNKET